MVNDTKVNDTWGKLVDRVSMAVGPWPTYQQAEVEHRNCRQPLTVTQQAADSQATGYPPPSPIRQTTQPQAHQSLGQDRQPSIDKNAPRINNYY
jgi:hypothetical protein